ncbi:MAG: TIGR04168 family protein [Synechococcaceae bacterium WB9_2_112]|nr:TIGR04168 family protein [Synechococcaceae bacterium WB9_2_112]
MRLAIAGDLHGQWDHSDHALLELLAPDALLVVGDLSDGTPRIPALLRQLELPVACVLGNHDSGKDASGHTLTRQLAALGPLHIGWQLRELRPADPACGAGVAVVGGRPGTAGGGFHLSRACTAVFGPLTLEQSADRIVAAAAAADPALPVVLLAHSGPAGLGSDAADICGRDWKQPSCDWGDQDLALAIDRIRRQRALPLVVFGHMHHRLKRGAGERRTLVVDRAGTAYLNTACVPRHLVDDAGMALRHFSWVEFDGQSLCSVSHRWYGLDGRLHYQEVLYRGEPSLAPAGAAPLSC